MLQLILDWSEVWAPLIALIISGAFIRRITGNDRLLLFYLIVAILLNAVADINWKYKSSMPAWFQDNNIVYNIHSIFRAILFAYFFLIHPYLQKNKPLRILLALYVLFVLIDFGFTESPFHFSSRIFSGESILLLTCNTTYFLAYVKDDDTKKEIKGAAFWVAAGLILYEATNFFIFLSYTELMKSRVNFANGIWNVHNVAYIIFCFSLCKAIYESRRR